MLKTNAPLVTWHSPILSLSSPWAKGWGFLPRTEPDRRRIRAPFLPHSGGVNSTEQPDSPDSTVVGGQIMESSVNSLLCCVSLSLLVKWDLSL